jgi:hypothetical protein
MFAGGADPTKDASSAVSSATQPLSAEQRFQQYAQLVEQGAPPEQIQQAQQQLAEVARQHPFELRKALPFFQNIIKKLHATTAFQQFRLPGRDHMVIDRRDQFEGEPAKEAKRETLEQAKEAAVDAGKKGETAKSDKVADVAKHLQMKEGKLVQARQAAGVQGADFRGVKGAGKGEEPIDEEMLTSFERFIVQRFEKGEQQAPKSADGKPHFLEKSETDWKAFFAAFGDRSVQKKVLIEEIREFLLRGVIPRLGKGIFIGDMHLADGRIEKFVRFSILAEALAKMKGTQPGEALSAEKLGQLAGEELLYLALAASRGREYLTGLLPSQGKFLDGRHEARAAEALGIPMHAQLEQRARQLRARRSAGGGGLGGLLEKDAESEPLPSQFIPWWRWGNLHQPKRTRWITRVFYGALLIMSLLGIAMVTLRILKGV